MASSDSRRTITLPLVLHRSSEIDEYSMPAYSLIGQSIELSLKAFLRAKGVSMKELRSSIGHDLVAAIRRARALGLDRQVKRRGVRWGAVDALSDPYKGHRFRYIVTGTVSLPPWDDLDVAAKSLISGLYEHAVRASFSRAAGQPLLTQRARFFSQSNRRTP